MSSLEKSLLVLSHFRKGYLLLMFLGVGVVHLAVEPESEGHQITWTRSYWWL